MRYFIWNALFRQNSFFRPLSQAVAGRGTAYKHYTTQKPTRKETAVCHNFTRWSNLCRGSGGKETAVCHHFTRWSDLYCVSSSKHVPSLRMANICLTL